MSTPITFGSVCSGIEAASVAWHPLGWRAAWLSEIEANPSTILAHHYPDVPNLGDMTHIPQLLRNGDIPPPDVFCGGTPCQAFSLAGLRNSLNDARGNLSLTFCEIANEIDIQRTANGLLPATVFWENVPGVLSTQDNAFGYFLAGLAGEDDPLIPPGKKWANAGCVYGPQRAVAWRVLDAQYFGLAQRRKRVFVVASARNGFDPAAVLFEFDRMRRDSAPSREARQETAGTLAARTDGGGFQGTDEACSGYIQPVGPVLRGGNTSGAIDVAACLTAKGQRIDFEVETFAVQPLAHAFDARQSDVLQYGDFTGPLDTRGSTIGVLTGPAVAFSCKDYGADASVELAPTMRAMGHAGSHANAGGQLAVAEPIPIDMRQASRGATMTNNRAAGSSGGAPGTGIGNQGDPCPTLSTSHVPAVCTVAQCVTGDITHTLKAEGFDASEDGTGRGQPIVAHDTLYNKGFTHKEAYASAQETYAGTLLRSLQQEVGEKTFAKWGLGILGSLQQAEILRQALHGISVRPAPFSRSWVVDCALSRQEDRTAWLLQSLREAGCERCASQGWQPPEQLARELGAYLSELSQPGAQAARFVFDLWQACEGVGVLRQALSAIQEMGRSAYGQEESARGAMRVRRLTVEECEFLQGFPRGYTAVPLPERRKDARGEVRVMADGPRYKALGNSWPVPVVAWIGRRIDAQLRALNARAA